MPSTYASLYYHLVFSTKERTPFIEREWHADLHGNLGGAIKGMGGVSLAIGGVADHVHILASLKTTHCLADFMRDLKKDSSS